jgi:hypothetical protein
MGHVSCVGLVTSNRATVIIHLYIFEKKKKKGSSQPLWILNILTVTS